MITYQPVTDWTQTENPLCLSDRFFPCTVFLPMIESLKNHFFSFGFCCLSGFWKANGTAFPDFFAFRTAYGKLKLIQGWAVPQHLLRNKIHTFSPPLILLTADPLFIFYKKVRQSLYSFSLILYKLLKQKKSDSQNIASKQILWIGFFIKYFVYFSTTSFGLSSSEHLSHL